MKKVGIGFVILFLLSALGYAGYWGVNSFLTKKAVKELVNNKDGDFIIGSAEAKVSAFPYSKNIIFKNVKYPITDAGFIELSDLEVEQSSFSSKNYVVKNIGTITIKDPKKNIDFGVRFALDTEIIVTKVEGKNILVEYKGSGYQILDSKNKVLLTLKTKDSNFSLSIAEDTIAYKSKSLGTQILDINNNILSASGPSAADIFVSLDKKTQEKKIKIAYDIKDSKQIDISSIRKDLTRALIANNGRELFNLLSAVASKDKPKNPINFSIDTEVNSVQIASIPKYVVDFKLKNFEFATTLYKVALSGNVNTVEGDLFPSGKLTLKFQNFDKIVDLIKKTFIEESGKDLESIRRANQVVKNIKKEELANKKALNNGNDRLSQGDILNEADLQDVSGQKFFENKKSDQEKVLELIEKVRNTINSLAQNNPLSKGDVSVLAISRDKNSTMDAMINNTLFSQVITDFMAKKAEPVRDRRLTKPNAAHLDLQETME